METTTELPMLPAGYPRWILRPVTRIADADQAFCQACRVPITGNQFWGWDKSLWLHVHNGQCPNLLPSGRTRFNLAKNEWKRRESTAITMYKLEAI